MILGTREPRRRLARWSGWFCVANAALMGLIGLRYLAHYPWPQDTLGQLYAVTAYLGHFLLLASAPWLLIVLPILVLVPLPRVITPLCVLLAASGNSLLLLDSLVFAENGFHANGLILQLLDHRTWAFVTLYFLILVGLQTWLALTLRRRLDNARRGRRGLWVTAATFVCVIFSQSVHVWADASYYVPVTRFTRHLPLYHPLTAKRALTRMGWIDPSAARERSLAQGLGTSTDKEGTLHYPLAPLQCEAPSQPLNVVLILVDAMRAAIDRPAITPNIHQFAGDAIRFENHYSGGNSSRMGVFSIFYGLPGTYWGQFAAAKHPAVLIETMRAQGYEMAIFASDKLHRPSALDRTALARIPNLRVDTSSLSGRASEKDRNATNEWLAWLNERDTGQPFFGFLYYDAATQLDVPDGYQPRIEAPSNASPQQRRFATYRTALRYNDELVGEVLEDLRDRGLMRNSVVIVSADHGEEFGETAPGHGKHGSGYSHFQLHVPFVVHWPGKPARRVEQRTSHYDLVPTLMSDVLGCRNPPRDYSSGHNLFSGDEWDWLIAGSYHNFAVVEPDRVTISYPGGYVEVRDAAYRLTVKADLSAQTLGAALHEMGRFNATGDTLHTQSH
jgi:membrane-anchored protein YejM (alkaline phosphatase superfamily)